MSRLSIPTDALRKALVRTGLLTTNRSDRSPLLNSTEFHVSSTGLRLVSTDGWRIALVHLPVANAPDIDAAPVVDNDFLRWLHMRLRGTPAIDITFAPNEVMFQVGSHVFPAKLVREPFPEWEEELLGMQYFQVTVQRQLFVELLQKAMVDTVILKLNENAISFRAVSGSALGSVPTETPVPFAAEVNASPKFLLDYAALVETDVLQLAYSESPREPICLQAESGQFVYYLMPKTLS